MGDLVQESDKGSGYQSLTTEESNELIALMVDVINRGWRDHSGKINKITVERHILPPLNKKLGISRTYNQYKNREKFFKRQYVKYNNLMRHNSGFGWDPVTKFFTASDEVWADYFKSHPKETSLRTDPHPQYDDLRIAVGNGTTIWTNSIAIGDDILEDMRENGGMLDDLTYDPLNDVFTQSSTQDCFLASPEHSTVGKSSHEYQGSGVRPSAKKRAKIDSQTKSNSFNPKDTQDLINKLTTNVDKMARVIESIDTKEYNCWDLIKEIPGLDVEDRFRALDLLNTKARKSEFFNMTSEERAQWISYKLK